MSRSPYWILALSLVGISFAGPLVRLSSAHPVTIAVWRLGFSLVIVAILLVITGEWRDWRRLDRREFALALAGGVFLALHFWAWNASIHLTTIAASVTLVNLQPAIVAAISALTLREAPTRRQILGITLAIAGAFVVAGADFAAGFSPAANRPLLGNLLAASAALTAAVYYTIGRSLRMRIGVWAYVAIVYAAAFAVLLAIGVAETVPMVPQPGRELAIFAALAIGPMLLGHTGMNWALKFLPAYVVNLTVLGEPVGATLLGAIIPAIHQIPSRATLVGGAIVLLGVIVASRTSRDPQSNAREAAAS